MVVYTLEQRYKILRHYFENHGNVAECVRKLRMFAKSVRLDRISLGILTITVRIHQVCSIQAQISYSSYPG